MKALPRLGLAATVVGLGIAAALPAVGQSPTVNVGGRIHMDTAVYNDDVIPLNNGSLIRRARIGANGTLTDGWAYKVEWDFGGGGSVSANDLFISYKGLEAGDVKIGQFKVPFGLNELTSSNAITFIERSLGTEAFADARRLGIGIERFEDNYGYQGMVYTRNANASTTGDEPIGVAGRFVFNPMMSAESMVHLGVAVAFESLDDAETVLFRARPESRGGGGGSTRLVNTGSIDSSDSTLKVGLEAAWMAGPFSIEGEFMRTAVNRNSGAPDLEFDAFHIQGSYVFGGARSYRGGRFRGVTPGATELALRYSWLDLNDEAVVAGLPVGVAGGEQTNITLGLNYYATRSIRFMGNVIRVNQEDTGDKPWAFALRGQVSF